MIRILTDTGSDYTPAECAEKGIDLVPLQITMGERSYLDCTELSWDRFYEMLIHDGLSPKTSQPTPAAFLARFQEARSRGDEVICILLSSTLSGTYQSAVMAREMCGGEGIHVVDSLSAASGIRLLAEHAMALRDAGMGAEEIVRELEALKGRIRILFLVDTLEYLYRGGRLSKTAAMLGRLAHVKPVLGVDARGAVAVMEKSLGLSRAFSGIVKRVKQEPPDPTFPVYTIYSAGEENCEKLEELLRGAGCTLGERQRLGASIGAHVGPRAAGVLYIARKTK